MSGYVFVLARFAAVAAFVTFFSVAPAHAVAQCNNNNDVAGQEECDNGPSIVVDGCDDNCQVVPGWVCTGDPSVCRLTVCGDDITEGSEECDGEVCCAGDCTFATSATTCRATAGVCDAAETCTGSAADCPADTKSTSECRASAGPCDPAESCDGTANTCPTDAREPSTTVCRADSGACDPGPENCDGTNAACPADSFSTAGTPCRASVGICDTAEVCTGTTSTCPADAKSVAQCRASAGVCDPAEVCDGTSDTCPVDSKSSSQCRASAGGCDPAEVCDGTASTCPADAKSPSDTVCRASAGVCDPVAETCTGSSDTCPADTFASAGTACRAAAGTCDVAETCTGSTATCPSDAKQGSTTTCRPAAGDCDLAETCTGSTDTCPANSHKASSVVCRPQVNPVCDVAENCTGSSDNCPDDELVNCPDNDSLECTEATCDATIGCTVSDECVEVCRGAGFWQNHSGYEKDGTNVAQEILNDVGTLYVCGQEITTTSVGTISSALEGLCIRGQGVEQRKLYRQLVTAALNCAISQGTDCEQITQRYIDVSYDACNQLCIDNPEEGNYQECTQQLACFNSGGRITEEGDCARGTCEGDGETFCGADYGDCPDEQACERFEDSCSREDLCQDDLTDTDAQICPEKSRASSPRACHEARVQNQCSIDQIGSCF